MARGSKIKNNWDGNIYDEIDEFEQEQDNIKLNQAGVLNAPAAEEYELSDEEVLALSEQSSDLEDADDDLDDEQLYGEQKHASEEEKTGWGSKKSNYYGADEVQDEEEALREQEEALKIQKEQLKRLHTDDYFEEDDLEEWKRSAKEADKELEGLVEEMPQQDPSLLDSNERVEFLKVSHPEVLALRSELEKYRPVLEELKDVDSKIGAAKFSALSIYLGAIGIYFALFVSKNHENRQKLKDHGIMEAILKAKEVWRVAEQLKMEDEKEIKDFQLHSMQDNDLSQNEYDDTKDSDENESFVEELSTKRKRGADSISASDSESEQAYDSESDQVFNRESSTVDFDDEFTIGVPTSIKKISKAKAFNNDDYNDLEIDEADLEDKKARKRTLRFYTSKIDQQAQRVSEKYSGDADLPYRETKFEQRKRLLEEARLRGINGIGNSEVDNFGSDGEDDLKAQNGNEKTVTEEFEEDYYNTIKTASKQKKEDRKQAHELALEAARNGKLAELREEDLGDDGKRAINYQILKNKGLKSSKRKKDDRNSRVKKRKKYEKALKKLPSVRRVFKSPTTAYGGESTGIKKNISRGVKFSN